MAKIYYSMLTDLGLELATQAITTAAKIGIEQFAVGDGAGVYYAPTGAETALRREKFRGNVQRLEVNGSRILIEAVIPTTSTGYTVREIGVFTAAGEMVAIGNLPDIPKDAITDGAIGELLVSMELQVANTDVFELTVDPNTLLVTKPQLDKAMDQARIFTATFVADGWAADPDGGKWSQTAPCKDMRASYNTEPPFVKYTGVRDTDIALRDALDCLCAGGNIGETMDAAVQWTLYDAPPNCDLTIYLRRAVL